MRSGLHLSVCAVAALFSISMAEAAPAPGACAFLTKAEVKPFAQPGPLFDRIAPEEQPTRTGSLCHYSGLTLGVDPFAFSFVEADRAKAPAQFVQVPGSATSRIFAPRIRPTGRRSSSEPGSAYSSRKRLTAPRRPQTEPRTD